MTSTKPPFRKVLIANRGEISVRVQQSLRELGIVACAVYSDPDRTALHTLEADEAYPLGPGPSAQSYLDIDRVLQAAKLAQVDAIHPGYGFLSENPEFAQVVEEAGLVFIGPPPAAMRAMGNKLQARALMEAAGVPVIPGLSAPIKGVASARQAAGKIGYPVLLKAAAGGGGKGMRVVRGPQELAGAIERTQGEARGAFGDDAIFLERFVERPRHVEVQVMTDAHGHAVHLFERECSVQRRHQKVIEESPSPSISDAVRQRLCETALKVVGAVDYRGAGTVEFIVDENDDFFFLEMNTRLQVEHPITEAVVGVDLVAAQVRIAAGQPLPWRQEQLRQRGHALEFRIYAEDPWHDFAPSLGTVRRLHVPQGAGVRNDLGIREGYQVPIFYDPLLAKLIVHGESRAAALARGRHALDGYRLLGLVHNVPLHRWVLDHPRFVGGRYSTRFLEEDFDPAQLAREISPDELETLAAAMALVETGVDEASAGVGMLPPPLSPWAVQGRARMARRRPK